MTSLLKAVPKPTRDATDYKEKAIETASKIACFEGKCGYCGKSGLAHGTDIFAHHIIHRRYSSAAADLENLLPVCTECHGKIHHNEAAFKVWLEAKRPGLYERMWQKAREICSLDFEEVYSDLLEKLYDILKDKRDAEGETK